MTRRSFYCAVLLIGMATATLAATEPPQAPFDYRLSLYKAPNTTNADGGWTEKVLVYMGNDLFPGGPGYGVGTGPGYDIQFKVVDSAGHGVCSVFGLELVGFPTGWAYAPF